MPDRGKLEKQMEMSSIPREIPQHPFGSFTREKSDEKWALKHPPGSTKGKSEQSDSLWKLDEMVRQPFPSLSTIQQSEKREFTKYPLVATKRKSEQRKAQQLEFVPHPSSSTRKNLEQRELPQLSSEFTNRRSEQMEFPQHQSMSTRTKSKQRDFQKGPQMPIRGKFIKRKAVKNQSESARQMLLQKV